MIQGYIFDWLIEAAMLIMLISAIYRYAKMKPRTTRALVGLIAIFVLTLPVLIGIAVAIAHPSDITFLRTGLFNVVMVDIFAVVAIYQWTLIPMTTRDQRMARGVFTGEAIFMGVITLALLIDLHF